MRRLILVSSPFRGSAPRLSLKEGVQVLGRGSACDIIVNDDSVSRSHAEIIVTCGNVVVADLDSSNGTFIGRRAITRAALQPGERIRFGMLDFRLEVVSRDQPSELDAEPTERRGAGDGAVKLTPAQLRVLKLLKLGMREQEIADALGLKRTTVHTHIRAICRKYGVKSVRQLLALLLRGQNKDDSAERAQ